MAFAPQDTPSSSRQTRRCTHILTQSAIYLTASAASLKGFLAIMAWLNSELHTSERDALIVASILAPVGIPYYAENIIKIFDRAKESGFVKTASVIGGLLGAASQYGMVYNDRSDFVVKYPLAFALTIGISNIAVMGPNTPRAAKALKEICHAIHNFKIKTLSYEALNFMLSSIAASSYIVGAQKFAISLMGGGQGTLHASIGLGILCGLPQLGINMDGLDALIQKPAIENGARPSPSFCMQAIGMLLCALTNAFPSSWYTFTGLEPLLGFGFALSAAVITALFITITKGGAFTRFSDSLDRTFCHRHGREHTQYNSETTPLLHETGQQANPGSNQGSEATCDLTL